MSARQRARAARRVMATAPMPPITNAARGEVASTRKPAKRRRNPPDPNQPWRLSEEAEDAAEQPARDLLLEDRFGGDDRDPVAGAGDQLDKGATIATAGAIAPPAASRRSSARRRRASRDGSPAGHRRCRAGSRDGADRARADPARPRSIDAEGGGRAAESVSRTRKTTATLSTARKARIVQIEMTTARVTRLPQTEAPPVRTALSSDSGASTISGGRAGRRAPSAAEPRKVATLTSSGSSAPSAANRMPPSSQARRRCRGWSRCRAVRSPSISSPSSTRTGTAATRAGL